MTIRFPAVVVAAVAAITTTISSVVDAQFSPQDFVDHHNTARADVGVAPLAWDDTVAAHAGTFATERNCGKLPSGGGPYGVNTWLGTPGPGNWTWKAADVVALWVQEKQYYNCSSNSCKAGQLCMQYTQVVWANTTRFGCAKCEYSQGTFVVCEYDQR